MFGLFQKKTSEGGVITRCNFCKTILKDTKSKNWDNRVDYCDCEHLINMDYLNNKDLKDIFIARKYDFINSIEFDFIKNVIVNKIYRKEESEEIMGLVKLKKRVPKLKKKYKIKD